ncbi:hypothetical protein BFJ68_g5379 [Fusarium oxysporum]|uniref:Uncharacterized protein n=1 Tax=Fusarium oxysporum TaxID=5507 RepID=A0A420RGI4_FUSOX|nr:hypothetical protein BFJ68_g5379 [Fusarium oxysporum]
MSQPYGAITNGESRAENGIAAQSDETQALLAPKPGSRSWLRKRLSSDVRRDWADVMLLACYIITGILDSASISTWGAFVSMQTAACIVTWGPRGAGPDDTPWYVIVPIALVAFQSCGQAVASRALKFNALTSVVLTSIYCDLFSDAELFESIFVNAERNRRVAAPVLLLIGAIIGGLLAKSELGTSGALWVAAALKIIVMFGWAAWPAEEGS